MWGLGVGSVLPSWLVQTLSASAGIPLQPSGIPAWISQGLGAVPQLSCVQGVAAFPRQCLALGHSRGSPRARDPGLADPGGFGVPWSHRSGQCAWKHLEKGRACRRQGCKGPAVLCCALPQSMISPRNGRDPVPALPALCLTLGAVAGGKAQGHHPAPWCDRGHRAPASAPGG